jgi:hypothetical protein
MSGVVAATTYVKISNNNGFSFGDFMVVGEGIIGEAVVGDEYSVSKTFTNPTAVDIRQGRELLLDTYNTGSASVTVINPRPEVFDGAWNPFTFFGAWAGQIRPGIQMKITAEYPTTVLTCTGVGGTSTPSVAGAYVPSASNESLDVRIAFVVTDGLDGQTASLAEVGSSGNIAWLFYVSLGTINVQLSVNGSTLYTFNSLPLPQFKVGTSVALRFFFSGQTETVSFYYWETSPAFAFDVVNSSITWNLINTATNGSFNAPFAANGYKLYQSTSALKISSSAFMSSGKFNLLAFCLKTMVAIGNIYTTRSSFDMTDGTKTLGASTFTDEESHTWTNSTSTATSITFVYPLFAGYISSFDWSWIKGVVGQNTVTFNAEDAFKPLNMVEVETVTGANTNDLPGPRMTQVLDQIGYPTSGLSLSTGDTPLQDDEDTVRTVLPLLQKIAESDLGDLYVDKTGFLKFVDRDTIQRQLNATPIYFSDDPNTEGYEYQDLNVAYDDSQIFNDVSIDNGGDVQQVTDSASIATYFRRSMSKTGLLMENEADALLMAQTILANRRDPTIRVTNIGLDITKAPTIEDQRLLSSVLGVDFGHPLVIAKDWYQDLPPNFIGIEGAAVLSDLLTVQGISHTIRPDRWVVEFNTAIPLIGKF